MISRQRYIPCVNNSGETAPAYGACEVERFLSDGTAVIKKPDRDDSPAAWIIGGASIEDKAGGLITWMMPSKALLNDIDGEPDNGESLGTRSGYWQLHRGYEGFLVWGLPSPTDEPTGIVIQRDTLCRQQSSDGYYGAYYSTQSSSSPRLPNGCGGCNCCPCVCWWATNWHKSLNASSFLVGPVTSPAPHWTLVSNGLSLQNSNPDWMYLGDIASSAGACDIGGLSAIDANGDFLDASLCPYWQGDLVYSGLNRLGVPVLVTINVTFRIVFDVQWACTDTSVADNFIWSGTSINSISGSDGGFLWDTNGIQIWELFPPGAGDYMDYGVLGNDIVGAAGTVTDCRVVEDFSPVGLVHLPPFELIPLYDPDCVGESGFWNGDWDGDWSGSW